MITKTLLLMLALFLTIVPVIKKRSGSSTIESANLFKVSRDTVYVSIEGTLSSALIIRNKYYAFYEVRDPLSTGSIKHFYIIARNGKVEKEIKVPKEIQDEYYYSLSYWHGQFLVNTEFTKGTFYLDLSKEEFVKNRELIKVPMFEDENYQLTSECHGEFGSTIFFKNRSTGRTYSTYSDCHFVVNRLGDKYFVSTSGAQMPVTNILEIEDPEKIASAAKSNSVEPLSGLASQNIFSTNSLESHFGIPTSFVSNSVLYHVYNSYHDDFSFDDKERIIITKDTVKIGTITEGKFKPLYVLKDHIDISLQQQLSPDYQTCTFHTEERHMIGFKKDIPPYKEGKYGFIEIKGNEIKIHYFFSRKTS